MEIRILWKNLEQSAALEDYFRQKIEHLEHYIRPILGADLEISHDCHHRKGKVYRAEARLALPKKTIYAEETAEHPYEAIDLLIERIQVQLDDYRDKRKIEHSKRRNLKAKEKIQKRITRIAFKKPSD